eukprot:1632037-Amphidinium_carterae.1
MTTELYIKFPYDKQDDEVVITGQTPPPPAPSKGSEPTTEQPTQQEDTTSQHDDQHQADTDRADELIGKLHMGLVLNALIKPGASRTELYDQIALPVGKMRKDVSRAKKAIEDVFTKKTEEIWVEIWRV